MKTELNNNSEYITLLSDIKLKVRNAQIKALVRVNSDIKDFQISQQIVDQLQPVLNQKVETNSKVKFPQVVGELQVADNSKVSDNSWIDEKVPQVVGEYYLVKTIENSWSLSFLCT